MREVPEPQAVSDVNWFVEAVVLANLLDGFRRKVHPRPSAS